MDVSFEFFPPKTPDGLQKLLETTRELSIYTPNYFSVTYGAGGSTRTRTLNTVDCLDKQFNYKIAPHISCMGTSKSTIVTLLDRYREMGLNKLVALRGDLPSGDMTMAGDFKYACELVAFVREHSGEHFDIEVAVYPESHPQASNIREDLLHFKQKVNAGASGAITQYFYDANAYYWLLENRDKMGIDVPITPGIMPIVNYKQLSRFSDLCGAEIPRWIRKRLESYGDDIASIKQFGVEVVTQLCEQLIKMGVPGLHFYTLNKSEACLKILGDLNLIQYKAVKESVHVQKTRLVY